MNAANIEGVESPTSVASPAEAQATPVFDMAQYEASGRGRSLEEEESVLNRKLMVFGTDVAQIPCFRNSFLYGILSGFGTGIGYFAFTSKVVQATNIGFYSYVGVTLIYWIQCRWNYAQTKFQYQQIQYAMQQNALYSGTEKGMKQTAADVKINLDEERLKTTKKL